MSFGLTNALATFQAAMNDFLHPYLRRFVLLFFNDMLIYNTNISDHLQHLVVIFNSLQEHKFIVKMVKCVFAVASVSYLGHIISSEGVKSDQEKKFKLGLAGNIAGDL